MNILSDISIPNVVIAIINFLAALLALINSIYLISKRRYKETAIKENKVLTSKRMKFGNWNYRLLKENFLKLLNFKNKQKRTLALSIFLTIFFSVLTIWTLSLQSKMKNTEEFLLDLMPIPESNSILQKNMFPIKMIC